MNIFFNYIYLDPRKPGKFEYDSVSFLYEPIYVGLGKNKRDMFHLTNKSHNLHLSRKLEKMKSIYKLDYLKTFVIRVDNHLSKEDAISNEIRLIKMIGRSNSNGPLTNQTDGGEGLLNCSEETRRSKSEKMSGDKCYMYGKSPSQEVRNKISKSLMGRKQPKETIDKIKATTNTAEFKARRYNDEWSKTSSAMQKGVRSCQWEITNQLTKSITTTRDLYKFCEDLGVKYSTIKNTIKSKKPIENGNGAGLQITGRIDWKDLPKSKLPTKVSMFLVESNCSVHS